MKKKYISDIYLFVLIFIFSPVYKSGVKLARRSTC